MEFPSVGKQCNQEDCKQLDFLPITCTLCCLGFCKDHSSPLSHNCQKQADNVITLKGTPDSFTCTTKDCKNTSPVEMLCKSCQQHFCLSHRHHECQEISKKDVQKWRAPKEQFKKVKAETDKQVEERLQSALQKSSANRSMVNKIKLMKIKGKAFGDNRVPTTDRVYFAVHYPHSENIAPKECRHLFVSKTWTVGKVIDFFANRMKISNSNNLQTAPKLRLFIKEGGDLVTHQMDIILDTLIKDQVLLDGDSVVLEYVQPDAIEKCEFVKISSGNYN